MNPQKKLASLMQNFMKKKTRVQEHIVKSENFEKYFQDQPSNGMFLLHFSDGTESDYKVIKKFVSEYGEIKSLVIISGINYGFLAYENINSAIIAYNTINDIRRNLPFLKPHPISLIYTPIDVRDLKIVKGCWCSYDPPVLGLTLTPDFISQEEENLLSDKLDSLE